ncbi:unnamed protein product [Lupinus luteus]|uniref:Uncharacterized protein n=1 Tax=Lupinus luteus TaxID=3873 RepID=A0AAV1X5W2_LUPLU
MQKGQWLLIEGTTFDIFNKSFSNKCSSKSHKQIKWLIIFYSFFSKQNNVPFVAFGFCFFLLNLSIFSFFTFSLFFYYNNIPNNQNPNILLHLLFSLLGCLCFSSLLLVFVFLQDMCPLRFILVFFSAVLAGYFAWRTVRTTPEIDMASSGSAMEKDDNNKEDFDVKKMVQNGFWVFVDMASGRYLWRNLKSKNNAIDELKSS